MLNWDDFSRLASRLNGVPVLGCRPGSPAARAGVRYGDVLMSVNDLPTPDWSSYVEGRARRRDRMRLEVFRAGDTLVFEFDLPAPETVDPSALLDELIEAGVTSLASSATRRDPEPS